MQEMRRWQFHDLKFCKGVDALCNCGRKGHSEKVCSQKKKDKLQQSGKFKASGSGEQTNYRVQLVDQKEDEDYESIMVLNVERNEDLKSYYMEGLMNGNKFRTMIDSGSPITIFALDEIKQIMKRENPPGARDDQMREVCGFQRETVNSDGIYVLRTTSE